MRFSTITNILIGISGAGLIVYSIFLSGPLGWIIWGIGMILIALAHIHFKQHNP